MTGRRALPIRSAGLLTPQFLRTCRTNLSVESKAVTDFKRTKPIMQPRSQGNLEQEMP